MTPARIMITAAEVVVLIGVMFAIDAALRRSHGVPLASRVPAFRGVQALGISGSPSILLLMSALSSPGSTGRSLAWVAAISSFGALLLCFAKYHRVQKVVKEFDGRVCLRCLYPLGEQEGRCTEYGTNYTADAVRASWVEEQLIKR